MPAAKAIAELSAADLAASPVWEWGTDEADAGDETWVCPVDANPVPVQGGYHVAVDITVADGSRHAGLASFHDGELEPDGVGIVASGGGYWCLAGAPHGQRETDAFIGRYGQPFDELFPATWTARVAFAGESQPRSGVVRDSDLSHA